MTASRIEGRAHISMAPDALSVRIFEKVWQTKPSNTCWFFWGFVFMPLAVLFIVFIGLPLKFILGLIEPALDRRVAAHESKKTDRELRKLLDPPPPKRRARFLAKLSHVMSAVWFRFGVALRWIGIVVAVLVGLAGAGFLIYTAITNPGAILKGLLALAVLLVGCASVLGVIALVASDHGRGVRTFGGRLRTFGRMFHDNTCAEIDFRHIEPGPMQRNTVPK